MWDLIKGLFKFLLSLVVITSVVVGVGVFCLHLQERL